MTLKQNPNVTVALNDTGVQFPEIYAFIKRMCNEWNLNLRVIKPETTFWKVAKEYGFPMFRGLYKERSKSKDGKPKCCQLLKEIPFRTFLKTSGFEATLTGLRAAESRMRMFGISQFGQYYYAKTLKHWRYHPIALWDQQQVNDYHVKHDIPICKIYGMGHDRTGCWCCTGYKTWQKSLRTSHPKMYRFLAKQTGQPTLWEYLDKEDCRQFLEEERLL